MNDRMKTFYTITLLLSICTGVISKELCDVRNANGLDPKSQKCDIEYVSTTPRVYRAACGTTAAFDFSPGSGVKFGKALVTNFISKTVQFSVETEGDDGKLRYYHVTARPNQGCYVTMGPTQVISEVHWITI
ncbi:uncharacterized protein EKO05_0000425 [Ascochyta rabiei]|uniref:uncharacterized protein n=1 Tax=Didymella rabiei TaxID=5454 RepID=UPI0021FB5685|nr:uncharacterized protein EKO05_0000425 [Ascochyta rabiei]UPX09742.1 hypothetical protein EKO05_0000425 [Ascochyta rabiei]